MASSALALTELVIIRLVDNWRISASDKERRISIPVGTGIIWDRLEMEGQLSNPHRKAAVAMDLIRLAMPRRVYTLIHADYIVEMFVEIVADKDRLPGHRITSEPASLRHFTALFTHRPRKGPQDNWGRNRTGGSNKVQDEDKVAQRLGQRLAGTRVLI